MTVENIVEEMQAPEYKEMVNEAVEKVDEIIDNPEPDHGRYPMETPNVTIPAETAVWIINKLYGQISVDEFMTLVSQMQKGGLIV